MTITRTVVNAGDPDYRPHAHADEGTTCETIDWVRTQGFPVGEKHVFQIGYEIVDCPLLRVWWMTHDELNAVDGRLVADMDFDLLPFCHVTEVALRGDLPSWWRPDLSEAAA